MATYIISYVKCNIKLYVTSVFKFLFSHYITTLQKAGTLSQVMPGAFHNKGFFPNAPQQLPVRLKAALQMLPFLIYIIVSIIIVAWYY